MGLFSGKKKIYVSSVTYNLAGDEADAINYLQFTVNQAIMNNNDIADSLRGSYMHGQGVKSKLAYRYARDYYPLGLPYSQLQIASIDDSAPIKAVLTALNPSAADVSVLSAQAGSAQYEWWAKQYLSNNYSFSENDGLMYAPPSGVQQDASISYDITQDNEIIITFTNSDNSTHEVSFTPSGYDPDKNYLCAVYVLFEGVSTDTSSETRDTEPDDEEGTTSSSISYWQDGEYYTATTTKVTTIDVPNQKTTIVTTIAIGKTSFNKYYLYQFGTNTQPTLESLFSVEDLSSPYYPTIPMRVDGTDMADSAHQSTELYKTSKKLLNKMGIKMDKIADTINDNESIDDIDYAFIVFSVNLNTTLRANQQYIYYFIKYLIQIQTSSESDWLDWVAKYELWDTTDPDAANRRTYISPPPVNVLKFYTPSAPSSNYQMSLQWQFAKSTMHTGQFQTGTKKGDVSITVSTDNTYQITTTTDINQSEAYTVDGSVLTIKFQVTEDSWDEVVIIGFFHKNYVYKGKSVDNTIHSAFGTDKDTGFLLPLNYDIIEDMGLVDFTQMSFNCNHIVFNCYQVVKQKWYQTSLFKVVIVVVAVVVTAISLGSATGPAAAAVGAVAAATGTSLIVAAIILATGSVVIGMLIGRILDEVAVSLFGEKYGHIIGAIATIIVMYYGAPAALSSIGSTSANAATTTASTASSNTSWLTADNIVQATAVVGKVGQAYLQGEFADIQAQMQSLQEGYTQEMDRINDLIADLTRQTSNIDTGWFRNGNIPNESMDTFLTRTLLTGSEVVELTHGLISNYAEIGLSLPDFNK